MTRNGILLCRNHMFFTSDVPAPRPPRSLAPNPPQCRLSYPTVSRSALVKRIRQLIATIQHPSSAGLALFSSPVDLDSDTIGVVTGQPNDDGTYKVIFKKQGSPAQQVDISSDDVLLAADVLRDLISLGCDPDTGENLYLAEIEW